jgi:CheY-like chemotaxis protein
VDVNRDAADLPLLLLVENTFDDEMMWFKGILKTRIPCRVTVRRNCDEALRSLLEADEPLPALIVLDNRATGNNCMSLVTQLRLNDRTKSIPVVMFEGSRDRDEPPPRDAVTAGIHAAKSGGLRDHAVRLSKVAQYWLKTNQTAELGFPNN